MTDTTIAYRDPKPEDLTFIFDAWIKSYGESLYGKDLPLDFRNKQHDSIADLVSRSSALLACLSDDPDSLVGFIVFESQPQTRVHYLYVKYPFRKKGIAQELVAKINPSTPIIYTHSTRRLQEIRANQFLPIISEREFLELDGRDFGAWFIEQLPTLRRKRDAIHLRRKKPL